VERVLRAHPGMTTPAPPRRGPSPPPPWTVALAAGALALAAAPPRTDACTTFRLRAGDGAWVIGRSQENAIPFDSQVMVVPRGQKFTATRPDGKAGMSWVARYGFVGMNTMGVDIPSDGMNEAGLSVGALSFPGFARYAPLPPEGSEAISNLELPNWLLARFATVGEVREALARVPVYDLTVPPMPQQPLHWAVFDAQGGALVVEYVEGRLRMHDNAVGVLTNSPPFDWQMTNLRNHVNLTNMNVEPLRLGAVEIDPIGQGTGLLGLPGDYTPPSRFVKTTALVYAARPVATAPEAVNLAFHLLNAVDIPLGAVASKVPGKGEGAPTLMYELTQWATVHDLTNRVCYLRSYGNLAVRSIDLRRLDLSGTGIRHVPVPTAMQAEDVTAQAR
jgi:choloylglycine hydrolase